VVVAVVAVRVVQVAIHQVIDMIAVRDRFVTATGAMHVPRLVAGAGRGVAVGIRGTDFDDVLFNVITFDVFQLPIVQVIDVAVMFYRDAFVKFGVAHIFDVLRFN
jgi:hypothetical protein